MLKNIKLVDYNKNIERGCILRCKGKIPHEDYVDFIVIEFYPDTSRRYALVVISGYKAGLIYSMLPEESLPEENEGYVINLEWLKRNWHKWGYFECPLDDVYIIFREPPTDISSD